jgi:transcription antitermination factor NusG
MEISGPIGDRTGPLFTLDPEVFNWAVLRCCSSRTTVLATTLRAHDLRAWAPVVRVRKRLPRSRKFVFKNRMLLPSFVFVDEDQVDEAIDLRDKGQVVQCQLFLFNGERPVIPTAQLQGLERAQEILAQETRKDQKFRIGDWVKVGCPSFQGLEAQVIGTQGKRAYHVQFKGAETIIVVPGFLLMSHVT